MGYILLGIGLASLTVFGLADAASGQAGAAPEWQKPATRWLEQDAGPGEPHVPTMIERAAAVPDIQADLAPTSSLMSPTVGLRPADTPRSSPFSNGAWSSSQWSTRPRTRIVGSTDATGGAVVPNGSGKSFTRTHH